jgi:LmbE family N-acetylglucosaminyl deacetylase
MLPFTLGNPGRPLRVLCLGAHSDDIEIGCGGTVLYLLDSNPDANVYWIVFGAEGEREAEARESAARFLADRQNTTVHVEPFPNSYYPEHWAAIKRVFEEELKPFAPDVVFTHFRNDRHQDHRVISNLTWNTFRDHLILEYEIPKYDGDLGRPTFYVPLSNAVVEQKMEIIMDGFATQRSRHWFSDETFRGLLRLRGLEAAATYAEAFHARKVCWSLQQRSPNVDST